jgi:hypothetical protein
MGTRKALDRQAGAPPQILPSGDSLTFHLKITGVRAGSRLLLRCDEAGNIWASIGKPEAVGSTGDSQTS